MSRTTRSLHDDHDATMDTMKTWLLAILFVVLPTAQSTSAAAGEPAPRAGRPTIAPSRSKPRATTPRRSRSSGKPRGSPRAMPTFRTAWGGARAHRRARRRRRRLPARARRAAGVPESVEQPDSGAGEVGQGARSRGAGARPRGRRRRRIRIATSRWGSHNPNRTSSGAIATFRRVLALAPRHTLARYNLALVLRRADRLPEALAELERALAIEPRPEAHYTMGVIYWHQGELDRAVSALRAAVAADPQYADAHDTLGERPQGRARLDRRERVVAARDCDPARLSRLRTTRSGKCCSSAATNAALAPSSTEAERLRHRAALEHEALVWTSVGSQKARCGGSDGSAEQFPSGHVGLRARTRRRTTRLAWSSSAWASAMRRARHSSGRGRSTPASFPLRISGSPGYPVATSGYCDSDTSISAAHPPHKRNPRSQRQACHRSGVGSITTPSQCASNGSPFARAPFCTSIRLVLHVDYALGGRYR